ncbi:unnamed protein product [Brassica napus]|uniref:(rape) hypothetical protein n=1 Tax=Brassica napus TaxID=3708 RepID=A0A816Z0D2_BRANA|nr:unnamed protein product [Brassica napus]
MHKHLGLADKLDSLYLFASLFSLLFYFFDLFSCGHFKLMCYDASMSSVVRFFLRIQVLNLCLCVNSHRLGSN